MKISELAMSRFCDATSAYDFKEAADDNTLIMNEHDPSSSGMTTKKIPVRTFVNLISTTPVVENNVNYYPVLCGLSDGNLRVIRYNDNVNEYTEMLPSTDNIFVNAC